MGKKEVYFLLANFFFCFILTKGFFVSLVPTNPEEIEYGWGDKEK